MNLSIKSFSQLIEDMGASLQSSASNLIDVSVGSVSRALFEANASVVLWLQWLILCVLQVTRAATSTGPDLDSWMADFGLTRLPAKPSSGTVTFSRFTPSLAANVPLGTTVKTADGSVIFRVTEDVTNSVWQQANSAYVIPAGVASATLPVTCTTGGQVGNVLAGAITTIASSLPGVDQVTNANPFANGIDSEADAPFRTRFQLYLSGLSCATLDAVRSAIANLQQGLNVCIMENVAANGTVQAGSFVVVVDDGSGYPSATLLATVSSAIDTVRPIGTIFSVQAPQVMIVNVTFNAAISTTSASSSTLLGTIQGNVAAYLDSLPIGAAASATRIAQQAYLAGSAVQNVSAVLLNGLATDVTPLATTVIKAGQIVVTPYAG